MMLARMAARNLLRHRRRSLLTGLSIVVGFVLSSFFIGWADGSYNLIIQKFTGNRTGQIQVHTGDYSGQPRMYKNYTLTEELAGVLDGDRRISSWTPRILAGGLVASDEKSSGASITGIDPDREERTTGLSSHVIKGNMLDSDSANEVLLGSGLAKALDATVGDDIIIVSQASDGSMANDRYSVRGIIEFGEAAFDRISLYMTLADADELFWMGGNIHEIAVVTERLKHVRGIAAGLRISDAVKNLDVETWKEFDESFYDAMMADKKGNYIMLLIVMVIVATGVLNTVVMSVMERRREYGLMKAVGESPGRIVGMVMTEVTLLSAVCVAAGAAIATVINFYFSHHGITLSQPLTYGGMNFDTMLSEINLNTYLIPAVTVFIAAVAVAVIPAVKAAKTDPAKTMRSF